MYTKYCFLDLETTGFDPKTCEILEIAFFVMENGKRTVEYDHVVKVSGDVPEIVTQITGISTEESHAGRNWADILPEITPLLKDCVIVGHNIDFDIRFLVENGITLDPTKRIDTHELARMALLDEASYSLEALSDKYALTHTNAHRAMSDVEASYELFLVLQKELGTLGADLLQKLVDFLPEKAKNMWFAVEVLEKVINSAETKTKQQTEETKEAVQREDFAKVALSAKHITTVRSFEAKKGADFLVSQAKAEENQKTLIVSPKLRYFAGIKPFPTPDVLFSVRKFTDWWQNLDKEDAFTPEKVAFGLQIWRRHLVGMRGKRFFALFANQYSLWNQVCMATEDADYEPIKKEKLAEKTLCISPNAYWRNADFFADRHILVDEGETFVKAMLGTPTRSFSFQHLLEHPQKGNQAAFLVAEFAQKVIEAELGRTIGVYPERILLTKPLGHYAEALLALETSENSTFWADILTTMPENAFVFGEYHPNKGNLSFYLWEKDNLKKQRAHLHSQKVLLTHRGQQITEFCATWLGKDSQKAENVTLYERKWALETPKTGFNVKGAEFNAETKRFVQDYMKKEGLKRGMMVFSSGDSLFKTGTMMKQDESIADFTILGERMAGGNGKLNQKLRSLPDDASVLLLVHKMLRPAMKSFAPEVIFVQKFPFDPPGMLTKEIENQFKARNRSFWDEWTIPHVSANLTRKMCGVSFENHPNIVILDPRNESRWGRTLLRNAF